MTTKEILKSIKERAEKATSPPWHTYIDAMGLYVPTKDEEGSDLVLLYGKSYLTERDMNFIAASRTDVPRLVAALERSRSLTSKFFTACLEGSFDKEFRSMVIDEIEKTEADINAILTGEK